MIIIIMTIIVVSIIINCPQGCRVLCGGRRELLPGALAGGWYLQPTVLGDCGDHMKVRSGESHMQVEGGE